MSQSKDAGDRLSALLRGILARGSRSRFLGIVAVLLAFSGCAADAKDGFFEEFRLGLLQHDTGLIGDQKETGADFSFELLSRQLTILRLIGTPRLIFGAVVNSARQTDQAYMGLIRSWTLSRGLFRADDGIFLEGVLAGDWNDGEINVLGTPRQTHWKSHGSHFLFRTGLNLGYRIDQNWSVAIDFSHISNAGLASPNEGMNDVGLTLNRRW